jgi:hypothetical protein
MMTNEERRRARRRASQDLQVAANEALRHLNAFTHLRAKVQELEAQPQTFDRRCLIASLKERAARVHADYAMARARSDALARQHGFDR